MNVSKIRDGLWRWEAPHPDWKPEYDRPGGWGRMVGCVYAEYDEAVVLIDPLVPADLAERDRFFSALDRDLARLAKPVLVLVGCVDHGRSADVVAERYRRAGTEARVVGDAAIRDGVSCALDGTFDDVPLPAGLHAVPIPGMAPGERAFVLDPWRAVVFADAVLGIGAGRVRLLRESVSRPAIHALLAASPEIVLPSHGDPVLTGGTAALADAL